MYKAKIFIPIFDYTIIFCFCEVHEYKRYEEEALNNPMNDIGFDGLCTHGIGSTFIRIFIDINLKDQRLLDVVYHESLHAANYTLSDLDIVQDTKTDELAARLQSYIAGQIIKRIKKWGEK